jgi:hypothetical protein
VEGLGLRLHATGVRDGAGVSREATMILKHLLAGAAFALCLSGAAVANAQTFILGNEDDVSGFVGNLLEQNFPGSQYMIASDGESGFDPFGAGYDTSDGINFNNVPHVWNQAADSHWNWLGGQTWVLPASSPTCGNENEPSCEPTGHWVSPDAWVPAAIGHFLLFEPDGRTLSDVLVTYNDANGANLKFYSDPNPNVNLNAIPEPAAWSMMLFGFFGLGAMLRGKRTVTA